MRVPEDVSVADKHCATAINHLSTAFLVVFCLQLLSITPVAAIQPDNRWLKNCETRLRSSIGKEKYKLIGHGRAITLSFVINKKGKIEKDPAPRFHRSSGAREINKLLLERVQSCEPFSIPSSFLGKDGTGVIVEVEKGKLQIFLVDPELIPADYHKTRNLLEKWLKDCANKIKVRWDHLRATTSMSTPPSCLIPVEANGGILSPTILDTSGHSLFDRDVLKAIAASVPFESPPVEWPKYAGPFRSPPATSAYYGGLVVEFRGSKVLLRLAEPAEEKRYKGASP